MDQRTAILVETGPSMDLGAPSKRLHATREALRILGGAGAFTPCEGAVRWVPAPALAATLGAARHVDLPGAARRLATLPVDRVVVIGDLYDPRAVLDAMGSLRGRERVFVEVLTPAERGAAPAGSVEKALVAYLETLRPHRERALGRLRASGVRLSEHSAGLAARAPGPNAESPEAEGSGAAALPEGRGSTSSCCRPGAP